MEEKSICEIVRRNENLYQSGNTTISRYVNFSLKDTVDTIEAYLFSKHTSGLTDSLGREKPFFNIVTAARNIWYRATDIDRSQIRIKATKNEDMIPAFLATVKLQEWMKKEGFGKFLNDWGRTLATYGSAIVEFVQKDGRLIPSVLPWNRTIIDPVRFDNDVVIKKLLLTPSQLKQNKNYNQELVDSLIANTIIRHDLSKTAMDIKPDFIEIYEVEGELSLKTLKLAKGEKPNEEDDDIFVNQLHVVSFTEKKENGEGYEDYTLYAGRTKKTKMITHLIEEDGRSIGIGAIEHLFDAQWMVNHSQKLIKDQLDLASKMIFQGSDDQFVGRNALTDIENGQFLLHNEGKPMTRLDTGNANIASIQAFGQVWQVAGQGITSTPDALRGDTPPSGTAWHTVELITQQSQSLFELMTENKGLYLEQMLREFIIPYLKTQLDTEEEIMATLESEDLMRLDAMYIPNKAIRLHNQNFIDTTLAHDPTDPNSPTPTPYDQTAMEGMVKQSLNTMGNQRAIKPTVMKDGQEVAVTWKEIFKDLEWEVEVNITGESSDTKSILETLSTTFKNIVALQGRPMTDQEKFVFNRILEQTGAVSPLQLSQLKDPTPHSPSLPAQVGTGGGLKS